MQLIITAPVLDSRPPATMPAQPIESGSPRLAPIARAQLTPRGFDSKVFDVAAGAAWSSGHATVQDAIQAVWKLGNPYRMVGVVEQAGVFSVVDLVTIDANGRVLDGLPLMHQGTDWIAAIPNTPLRAVHLLGDFGGPVDLLPTPPEVGG